MSNFFNKIRSNKVIKVIRRWHPPVIMAAVILFVFYFFFILSRDQVTVLKEFDDNREYIVVVPSEEREFGFANDIEYKDIEFLVLSNNPTYVTNSSVSVSMLTLEDGQRMSYEKVEVNNREKIEGEDFKYQAVVRLINKKKMPVAHYRLKVKNKGDSPIGIIISRNQINVQLLSDSKKVDYLIITIAVMMAFYVFVVWMRRKYDDFTIVRFFVLSSVVLGLIFLAITYHTEEEPGRFYSAIIKYAEELMRKGTNIELGKEIGYSYMNFFPQILGITLGKLLKLKEMWCIVIARVITLIFYIEGCVHAIRMTPIGKSILAMVSLLPSILSITCGFEMEIVAFVVMINLIAAIFALKNKPESIRFMIEALIFATLLGATKHGMGFLIIPIIGVLYNRKEKSKTIPKMVSIVVIALISFIIFNFVLSDMAPFLKTNAGNYSYQLAISKPGEYFEKMLMTYYQDWKNLLSGVLGGELLIENKISGIFVSLFILFIAIYAFFEKDEYVPRTSDKKYLILTVLITLLVVPFVEIKDVAIGSSVIYDIDYRNYMLLVPILSLLITKFGAKAPASFLKFEKEKTNEKVLKRINLLRGNCMYCAAMMLVLMIFSIMRSTFIN